MVVNKAWRERNWQMRQDRFFNFLLLLGLLLFGAVFLTLLQRKSRGSEIC